MEIKRGDIVLCVIAGDYGKPRPALVIQSDLFNAAHPSVTLLPITSYRIQTPLFRIPLKGNKANGLKQPSQVMVDKITAVRRDRIRQRIGKVSPAMLTKIEESLLRFLGFESR
ncbi:MAG: type II toxin-antitoxin system PemK/MazF family toxin [Puniceicoccaceae bacterium]|nr:MAG: type II toxin-antitoxin system PemK/MazF family toxin [Puniceicoccaceae bacterium]